ncbi:MAG TPA: class I SAM-dependent methyltransferase [Terriglobales bacterium]|nr:class I SAM-dependent methyltransferase [Terriglobales bacterium]
MNDPAEFDRFADNYDECLNDALAASGETKEFFARARVEWLAKRLAEYRLPARSVLDYGCGTGDTTALLREILAAQSVVGLDVSERSLERARTRHGGQCRFLTFAENVPDGSVDVVYCNGVFHHIPVAERAAAVAYIVQCLRPGGVFALWENNPWNPGTQYVMHKCEFDRDAVKIAPPEAARLLRNGGLEVLSADHRFFFPHSLRLMRPLEALLTKVPLGGQYQMLACKLAP